MSTAARRSFTELTLAALLLAGCGGSEPSGTAQSPAVEAPAPEVVDEPAEPEPEAPEADADVEVGADAPDADAPEIEAPGDPGTAPAPPDRTSDEAAEREALAALVASYEGPAPSAADLRAASGNAEGLLFSLANDAERPMAVRSGAIRALGTLGGPGAATKLGRLMGSDNADLRRAAIQGADPLLGGDMALRSKVSEHLRDADAPVARAAVLALGDVDSARTSLVALAEEDVPVVVRTALNQVLGTVGTPKAGGATKLEQPTPRSGGRGR